MEGRGRRTPKLALRIHVLKEIPWRVLEGTATRANVKFKISENLNSAFCRMDCRLQFILHNADSFILLIFSCNFSILQL